MADFDNLFDAAIARADETIRGYMGTSATMTSGEQSGAVIRGVFDDPENISYAGQGVRVEGSSPSLFVRTDDVRQLRRGDTLTIGEENFWIDRVSPDDGGSCYLWLNRGQPASLMALSEATEQAMFAKGVEINTRQLQMKAEVEALTDLKAIRSYVVGWPAG